MSSNDGVLFPYILLENFAENFALRVTSMLSMFR